MNLREQRPQKITNEHIQKIDNYSYKVKSQTSDNRYDVISTETGFMCSFPDVKFRKVTCKHSIALEISLQIRKRVEETKKEQVTINPIKIDGCKYCEYNNIIKKGLRKNKNYSIQTFQCKDCKKKFSINIGFEKLDSKTRIWIASQIADTKYTEDVRPLFKKSAEIAGKKAQGVTI